MVVLNVIGWFDQEDYMGMWGIFKSIEKYNPVNRNFVVVGPWSHGAWAESDGSQLGDVQFGARTSEYFRNEIELPFFNYYLKDRGQAPARKATVFETGGNRWHELSAWPPRGATRALYLQSNGRISFDIPPVGEGYDEYVSDPAKPVPWSEEIRNTQGAEWIIADQRFAARRPDALVYQSDPLTDDMSIAGPIIAHLFFSSSGTDADFIVKLIDVYPSNEPDPEPNPRGVRMGDYQMLVAGEVFRARYIEDFSHPKPLKPGAVTHLSYDLLDKFHTFKKGHRMTVQIQSTWFPLIDRNPQKFVPNIELAAEEEFQKATQRIYRSRRFPTHLEVTAVKNPID